MPPSIIFFGFYRSFLFLNYFRKQSNTAAAAKIHISLCINIPTVAFILFSLIDGTAVHYRLRIFISTKNYQQVTYHCCLALLVKFYDLIFA